LEQNVSYINAGHFAYCFQLRRLHISIRDYVNTRLEIEKNVTFLLFEHQQFFKFN